MDSSNELSRWLIESYQDNRLDQAERLELRNQLESLPEHQKAYLRNQAFHLVEAKAQEGELQKSLVWLHRIIKVIDQTHESINNRCYFSPGESCLEAILSLINSCRRSIDVCVFTISDDRIARALMEAHQAGVDIRIISDNDKQNDAGSDIYRLEEFGIAVKRDHTRHHMHHKFALFDSQQLLTGSFNWTRSATQVNHENILVTDDPKMIDAFEREFQSLWKRFTQ